MGIARESVTEYAANEPCTELENHALLCISVGELLGSLECDCPMKCETIHYEVQLSSSSYPSRHLLPILVRRINESAVVNVSDDLWSELEAKIR